MDADPLPGSEPGPPAPHPMGVAMVWVARIFAVALVMLLSGLAGHWLDRRFGTHFLVLVGFALGITGGIYHLIIATANLKRTAPFRSDRQEKRT